MNKNTSVPRVSVIVPVYNVAPYLRQCLDSIVHQTLREIEIICVDDGSTDESPAILREYADADSRIKVLTQQNLYVSAARNNGLDAAVGDYVIFLDSDDYFELNMLELLFAIAGERNADLVICNAQDFDDATGIDLGHNYLRKPYPETDVFNYRDCVDRIFDFSSMNCWNRLVRRSLLTENSVRFPLGGMTEDSVVTMLELLLAERIAVCPKRLVHYRVNRPNSLMTEYASRADATIDGCRECERQLRERGFLDDEMVRRSFLDKVAALYIGTLPYYGDFRQYSEYYKKMFLSGESLLSQWDMAWEPLPDAQKYLTARTLSPEEYLFGRFREMNTLDKVRRTRIRDLERVARELEKIRSSETYKAARLLSAPLRAAKKLISSKKEK